MSSLRISRSLLALALLLGGVPARAAVSLLHTASVYEDDKGKPLKDVDGVACADGGRFVVADSGNGRILDLRVAGKVVSGGAEWRVPELPYPTRLELGGKGVLYVLDRKVQRIGRVDAQGKFLGFVELKGDNVPAGVVPGSFKVDAAENLYVLDLASAKILVADATGQVVRQLELPRGGALFLDIAVDPAGAIYAVDAVGPSIWVAEKGAGAFRPLVKSLREWATFPTNATVSSGRLLVVDQAGQGLLVLGLDGTYQGRLLGMGWSDGAVYYPSQICVTDAGSAFLADRGNSRVQIFAMTR